MVLFDKRLQPVYTLLLDCPGKESIKLRPLPVVDPWVEDWWGREEAEWENAGIKIRRRVIFFQYM